MQLLGFARTYALQLLYEYTFAGHIMCKHKIYKIYIATYIFKKSCENIYQS